jgi:putative sterol carrier protein
MLPYATPEWLEAVGKNYRANPENQNKHFKGLSIYLTFRILADPNLGIDKDIYFSVHVEDGALMDDSAIISKEEAEKKSDFILSATPQVWKKLIRKQQGFVSSFMTNKIKLDKGLAPKILSLASKSGALVEPFYQVDTEWPDEMSPQRLEQYRAHIREFRERLKV